MACLTCLCAPAHCPAALLCGSQSRKVFSGCLSFAPFLEGLHPPLPPILTVCSRCSFYPFGSVQVHLLPQNRDAPPRAWAPPLHLMTPYPAQVTSPAGVTPSRLLLRCPQSSTSPHSDKTRRLALQSAGHFFQTLLWSPSHSHCSQARDPRKHSRGRRPHCPLQTSLHPPWLCIRDPSGGSIRALSLNSTPFSYPFRKTPSLH